MIITVNDTDFYTSFIVLLNGMEMLHCVYVDTDLGFIRVHRWDVDKDSPMFDKNYNIQVLKLRIRSIKQLQKIPQC